MPSKERVDAFGGLVSLKQWHVVAFVTFLISTAVFIMSILLFTSFPSIIETNIRKSSILTRDSALYHKWSRPHYALTSQMSVFSVQNPDDVLNGTTPQVKMIGPYVFDQRIRREVHAVENGTVKFETFRSYHFNEENSCLDCFLHNRIWVPNLIYQKFVEAASKPAMRAASTALLVQTPFLEVEVAELLFDGYTDPFLDQVCAVPFVNFICDTILNLPEKIGFFYNKNESSSGVYVVDDGSADEGESLGRILSFNDQTQLPDSWWDSVEVARIQGTLDGTLFPPYINKEDNLTVFAPELCRSLTMVFAEEFDYHGIPAYKFVVPASEFDFTLTSNRGYCNRESPKRYFADQKSNDCLPNGLLDISRCQKGEPPVILSLPNFLYSPDFVRRSVRGLREADADLDQIEVVFEPRLGAVLEARRRFQINVAMWHGVDLPDLSYFRDSVVPVVRIDETARIDQSNFDTIKTKLIYLENAVTTATTVAAILSIVAAVLVVLYVIHRVRGSKFDLRAAEKSGSPVKQYIKRTLPRQSEQVSYAVSDLPSGGATAAKELPQPTKSAAAAMRQSD